jgi:hypothetical protein
MSLNLGTRRGLILREIMRRCALIFALLGLLAIPALSAGAPRPSPAGNLVVRDARGSIAIVATGGVIGRFDSGRIVIEDPKSGDGTGPIVYGADSIRDLSDTKTMYIGNDVRFRLIGGFFRAKVTATGLDTSFVGHGIVVVDGCGFVEPGTYSVNGGSFQPMPCPAVRVQLGGPSNNGSPGDKVDRSK